MTTRLLDSSDLPDFLSVAQGSYFLVVGFWPLFSISTFQKLTGPKTDIWLVKTTAVLLAVIGVVLLVAGLRRQVVGEIFLLAIGSSAALAGVEAVYFIAGRIPGIYLLDALGEFLLMIAWLFAWKRRRRNQSRTVWQLQRYYLYSSK